MMQLPERFLIWQRGENDEGPIYGCKTLDSDEKTILRCIIPGQQFVIAKRESTGKVMSRVIMQSETIERAKK